MCDDNNKASDALDEISRTLDRALEELFLSHVRPSAQRHQQLCEKNLRMAAASEHK
jgi:hypothetical protein